MKFPLAFSILSTAVAMLSFPLFQAEGVPINNQSFEQWCLEKDALATDPRRTVDVLLGIADTQNCKLADSKLSRLSEISLSNSRITNLTPLSGLSNLTQILHHS